MNTGVVIKQLEEVVRKRHQINGGFKIDFHYQGHCVMFSIIGVDKKRITQTPEVLCYVDEKGAFTPQFPLDLLGLLRQFAKRNNLKLRDLPRWSLGVTLLNCIKYYYGLHATIPVSLYGVD